MRKLKLQKYLVLIWIISACTLCACTEQSVQQKDIPAPIEKDYDESPGVSEITDVSESSETESQLTEETESFQLEDIPDYSGETYVEINNNIPAFNEEEKEMTKPFEFYSELDSLGRCGQAYANVCVEIQPTEQREAIGQVKPSGWHTVKYNELIDGNYLYNRGHLIGYQLAGENANEKNLITGTRYLNVKGMLPFENMVDEYVERTRNHVLYRVTPVFKEKNLVANGVQMEAWSVEDKGQGICFNVYCYNVQPYIAIDYATGESWIAEESAAAEDTESIDTEVNEQYFIVNTNTKKFHLPSCASVNSMKEKNKMTYEGTAEELIDQGYKPCQNCLGE